MKSFFKVIFKIILAFTIVALILIFLVFSARSEIVPNIYVTSDSGKIATAVKGGYTWNSFTESIIVDSISPSEYIYSNDNILLVTPEEKITFSNSQNSLNRYKFYQLEMKYYDESNQEFIVPEPEDSTAYADLKYLEVNAPKEEGAYIYNFKFSYYNKGEVEYGLKVIVSTEPNYEIANLINYRNTKITDVTNINNILNLLPYSKYKNGVIVRDNSESKELIINYEEFVMEREELTNNIIALFTLIPDLNLVTYKSKTESYVFTREEIENLVGRALEDYSNNFELWKKEILFKEKIVDENSSRDMIYKAIIADVVSELNAEETTEIMIDTQSFKEAKALSITDVDKKEILDYALSFANNIYDVEFDYYKALNSDSLFISLVEMKEKIEILKEQMSGDIISTNQEEISISGNNIVIDNENIDFDKYKDVYICTIIVSKNKSSKLLSYEVEYKNGKWNITELIEE